MFISVCFEPQLKNKLVRFNRQVAVVSFTEYPLGGSLVRKLSFKRIKKLPGP